MAGDGVAVIEVAKLAKIDLNFASAVHCQTYLVGLDFGERTEFAIGDPFRSKRSADLQAITCGEGAPCLVVNAHTGKPRRVIGELVKRYGRRAALAVPSIATKQVSPHII